MDFGQILLLCCVIPFFALVIITFFIVTNLSKFLARLPEWVAPDTAELHDDYQQIKAEYPNETRQQLVKRVINKYAMRQGIVGAVTSAGGFIALPLGLSIDLVYSARSNAALSHFIAELYGVRSENKSLNLGQLLVLRQKKSISPDEIVMWQEQFAGTAYQQIAQSVLQKTLAKIIPGVGLFIGFAVNWSSAQVFGRVADAYYSGNLETLIGQGTGILKDVSSVEKREELWQGFVDVSAKLVDSGIIGVAAISDKLQSQNYDPTADRITQLQNLVELKEKGALTQEEFETMKQAIMGGLAEQMDVVEEEVMSETYAEDNYEQPNDPSDMSDDQNDTSRSNTDS